MKKVLTHGNFFALKRVKFQVQKLLFGSRQAHNGTSEVVVIAEGKLTSYLPY